MHLIHWNPLNSRFTNGDFTSSILKYKWLLIYILKIEIVRKLTLYCSPYISNSHLIASRWSHPLWKFRFYQDFPPNYQENETPYCKRRCLWGSAWVCALHEADEWHLNLFYSSKDYRQRAASFQMSRMVPDNTVH